MARAAFGTEGSANLVRTGAAFVRRSGVAVTRFVADAVKTRRTFGNGVAVAVLGGIALPSRIPPASGLAALARRRMTFRLRMGPSLTTELGNASPIIEVFRDHHYDVPIDWGSVKRVVDVGAHVGAFAVFVALRAPDARIVSFEPEPRNYRDLGWNIERNGLAERVTTVNAAVAAEEGDRVLYVPDLQREGSSLGRLSNGEAIRVRCIELERFLTHQVPEFIDVLKLDCEGEEWELLASLHTRTLARIRNVLVEAHAQEAGQIEELRQFFVEAGFVPWVLRLERDVAGYPTLATIWASRR